MKKIYLMAASFMLFSTAMISQSFNNASTMLSTSYHSGGVTAVVDMDNDGLDDIVILDESVNLFVAYQQTDGTFNTSNYGAVSGEAQWGMCVGDIDNDGHLDVMCGGSYDLVHVINIDSPTVYTLTDLSWAYIFTQGCNMADIDNDGWLDAFFCHDDGHSAMPHNNGDGTFSNGAALIDLTFYPEVAGGNDNSGNYGSVWTDFDRDGDTDCFIAKCRQFINDPYDARRTNILLVNDGNNNYTDKAGERGLINLQQSWTSDFADLDNDGDFDCFLTTHSGTLEIYANDGLGYFTNVTAGSGLEVSGFFLQGKFHDFDNDGYLDLIHAGGDHGFYHNNGDMTFTSMPNTFAANDVMHSFAIGDLNHDGYLDLYANYGDNYVTPDLANSDRIFMNSGGDNGFIAFDLAGTISNTEAVGAIVEIHGPWGTQIREIRAGESYGITNTQMCHFGIGSATSIDYAVIYWPAGGVKVIDNPAINTWHEITEGECPSPTAAISAQGDLVMCPGESVVISIDQSEGSYQWSNGSTESTITASQSGSYYLLVWDTEGCGGISNAINVIVQPDPIPSITVSGETQFCEGGSVQLISSLGNNYTWSNAQPTQAITVTTSGTYSVEVVGGCQTLTSSSVEVIVYDAPLAVNVNDVTISTPSTVTLSTTGNDIRWYATQNATTPLYMGNDFTTPLVNATTSYWVEDMIVHGGDPANGAKAAKESNSESGYLSNGNYWIVFDALENMVINTVKVYAGSAGNRTIQVVDGNGNVVSQGTFNIPMGESVVNLNLFVPQGTGYGLRASGNLVDLWRDKDLSTDVPLDYPYTVGSLATITGTTVSGDIKDNYYYFFYDWNVETESFECPSERTEVQVIFTGIEELIGTNSMKLYPNPASSFLNVNFESTTFALMHVRLLDQVGKVVLNTQWNTSVGGNSNQLDVNNIAPGFYQLEFELNGHKALAKIVVE
jgi:hypothetical protein